MNLFASEIFRNAFIASTIVAVVAAPVGYFLVLRAQVFAGEALKDIGFAGATGAALLGFGSIIGMLAFAVAAALALGSLSERMRGRDIEVGMVLSVALGIGVLFLSIWAHSSAAHASSGVTILFGSALTISRSDLLIAAGSGVVVLAALALLFRPLLFASVDPTVAEARGVPIRVLSLAFTVLLAFTVSSSVLVVGVLLVSALLIAPAAVGINLAHSPWRSIGIALLVSLGATWAGLALAFFPGAGHLPIGFTISAFAALAYLASHVARRPAAVHLSHHPDREVGRGSPPLPDRGSP